MVPKTNSAKVGDRSDNFYHLNNSILFLLGSKYTEKNSSGATQFPTNSEKSKDLTEVCTTRNTDFLGISALTAKPG